MAFHGIELLVYILDPQTLYLNIFVAMGIIGSGTDPWGCEPRSFRVYYIRSSNSLPFVATGSTG